MHKPRPIFSAFDHIHDVIVCGSGMIGFAAAKAIVSSGRSVLLINTSGDLLWECSLALENSTDNSVASGAWSAWRQQLDTHKGTRPGFFDGALAETLAAHELENTKGLSSLLYAMPVSAEIEHGLLSSITVATKSGPRRLRARQWVDASETGLIAQHCLASSASLKRTPSISYRSLILQSTAWAPSGAMPPARPGAEWILSVRDTERRLRWTVSNDVAWHDDILSMVRQLRETISVPFLVSHASQRDFPIYEATTSTVATSMPANLLALSPAFTSQPLTSVSERFQFGATASAHLAMMSSCEEDIKTPAATLPVPTETRTNTVFIAGAGTAGTLAAIAAASQKADTLAIDTSLFPGGIGTDGGINKYCAGLPGGLQGRLDDLTAQFSLLVAGTGTFGPVWHHLGKCLAILTLFAETGVHYQGGAMLCGVEKTDVGKVESALVAIDGHLVRMRAKAFIDSTGDGDLCALAEADFTLGRANDGLCLAFSQVGYALKETTDNLSVVSRNYDAGWGDPTDPEDHTRARLRGLAQYYRPEWTDSGRPFALASTLGLRQSRQIATEATVTFDDLINSTTFADSIGGARTFADTHAVDFEFETDDALFYYWVCQSFRHPLQCELPYRMLIPKGLTNVWIACRAAGLDVTAAYGIRMQRDMQRLGEAAGTAAALASHTSGESRKVDILHLQELLKNSGAYGPPVVTAKPDLAELQALLETGRAGIHLWHIYRQRDVFGPTVEKHLLSSNPTVSFQAAALLAMWGSPKAETRLLAALQNREQGPPPDCGKGAFAQDVDIPYWLLAVVLLRRCDSDLCLSLLHELAAEDLPFNVRTCIALTLEQVSRPENAAMVFKIQERLLINLQAVAIQPPSRSVRRMLEGKPQIVLRNDTGADTNEDQSWQLHLVITRTRRHLNLAESPESLAFCNDRRSYVRKAFTSLISATNTRRVPPTKPLNVT